MSRYRVAMDIGGTFTDAVAYDEETGTYVAGKASTTPKDLTDGVFGALGTVVEDPSEVSFSVHGTTAGPERLPASAAARGSCCWPPRAPATSTTSPAATATRLYDIHFRKPTPLVPRRDIVEIAGRLDCDGQELDAAGRGGGPGGRPPGRDEGSGAIAVALLFSLRQPAHELRAAARSCARRRRTWPSRCSHRGRPRVARVRAHVLHCARRLRRADRAPLPRAARVELHERGPDRAAARDAVQRRHRSAPLATAHTLQTLLSGPVGGTMGGVALARLTRPQNLICVDMGGTSFDVSLVVDGGRTSRPRREIEGFPLLMPVVEHPHGRRGRRLASPTWRPAACASVPSSAGADPGPACYGRGGTEPTVTDANVVLGRVDPAWFAGGQMTLDVAAAGDGRRRAGRAPGSRRRSSWPRASAPSPTRRWPRRSAH